MFSSVVRKVAAPQKVLQSIQGCRFVRPVALLNPATTSTSTTTFTTSPITTSSRSISSTPILNMSEDKFQIKADRYDKESHVIASIKVIGEVLCKTIELKPDMELLDFGAGTGLLLTQVAPHVAKISAVDISPSMTEQLRKKEADIPCQVEILEMDLCTQPLDKTFDGIISSMTFHHIEDVPALLVKLKTLLKPGGFIAIADLEPEDGSFHDEDTGVFHLGFEGDFLVKAATDAGFQKAQVCPASIIKKPTRDYPVQLLTAFV